MNAHLPLMADIADPQLTQALQHKLDHKTKPLGSLGRLESLGLALGQILGTETPALEQPQMVVFAGDHGLAARGVSAFPSDVTWQMVENFLAGGAAVSVLARQHGLALTVVDCGVARDIAPREAAPGQPRLLLRKVAPGTNDASQGPAMSAAQCAQALANGIELVRELPGNVLLLGEMFITSAAVLVASRLQPHVLQRCVFAHRSGERGHQLMLAQMQAEPLLDLGLRLGEGSGAALAWPLLPSACAILREMASFEAAGVSGQTVAA